MASSGLYEWLLKVVSESGDLGGGEEGEGVHGHGHGTQTHSHSRKKGDEEKQLLGISLPCRVGSTRGSDN